MTRGIFDENKKKLEEHIELIKKNQLSIDSV